ncbi:hypothetical protein CABS01_02755 [Colletotrichum abscissum]|uniref:Extracellular membrane protein CFEM domain-containing protein n=1 Tax=Colletotrichum abscissum TaxID=1671311 RepID=A0A9P9XKS4_9PEZI|nr:uncharacterized protein CABS01_02755 [Colletotrichum abscissum]KAI3555609.1 hypothetical protein CABS02_03985 [Colletotrichum abscissum]KAK1483019.1 hypothetical protein CABS01_02755 [Colletotrichum abscissum]
MSRLLTALALVGLGANVAMGIPFDQEEQNRNAECDNGCFFGSFPGGSCTNDAACMCTQQKYRERYFCCMAQKCAASVLPDSIQRQTLECEARNMPFTFDTEAVCGIKLTTSTSVAPTVTVTVTGGAGTQSSVPSASGSSSVLVATTMASTPVIAPTLSAGVNTPTATSSSGSAGRLRGSLVLVAAAGWMFW